MIDLDLTMGDNPMGKRSWNVRLIAAFALACLLAAALITWMIWPTQPQPAGSSAPLPPAKEQRNAGPMVAIAPKAPVKTVPPKAKRSLGLPQTVQDDADQHVLATARINAEARPYTISAVLNDHTGDTAIYARPDTLPWVGLESASAVGIHAGIRSDGAQIIRLSARHDVVRAKALHAGLAGTIDSDGQWFAGVGAEWRY